MKSVLFWGKGRPSEDGTFETHPLVCHCLDVAAVADTLLGRFPNRLAWLSRVLGADPHFLQNLMVRLVALHDLGKFYPDFQAKLEGYCQKQLPALVPFGRPVHVKHDVLGFHMSRKLQIQRYFDAQLPDWCPGDFNAVFDAVAYHHGAPAGTDGTGVLRACAVIAPAIQEFIEGFFVIVPLEGALHPPAVRRLGTFSWALAGLTVLADWIGSNSEIFQFSPPPDSLACYWLEAKAKAERAVSKAGILPVEAHTFANPAEFLPQPKGGSEKPEASPLQRLAFELPLGEAGPRLFIIEDVTGAGKTEAALILASRLLCEGAASGLYVALPTMATSNAMYERMSDIYRRLFDGPQPPSLVLAHGRRSLHEGFTNSILETGVLHGPARGGEITEPSEAACAAWIADDRRKSFFAHVGVGTIDQALLGVLPSRHQALRLWGLADRILIVDEAHCYDAYVNKELERLIEFQTALGGSTIVLSATLAENARRSLASAYCQGAQIPQQTPSSAAYPLVTVVSGEGTSEHPAATREELRRTLPLRRLESFEDALGTVAAAAEAGAPVAWIRNAVDDAIEACEKLEALGLHPLLLHARFAMGDRLEKERDIARRLGRESTPADRRGFIVVGTQILEQSLDYDVDAMVTDLAPIDLIIQRAGRLWRHPRRAGRLVPAPELSIFSPDPDDVRDGKWYSAMSPRAAAVYRNHRVIWLTAKVLFRAKAIRSPDTLRDLISQVYDTDEPAPAAIEAAAREAEGKDYCAKAIAGGSLLDLSEGYAGNVRVWQDDRKVLTRLGDEPSVVFRLGRVEGGKVVPWCQPASGGEKDLRLAWALSEVSIQERRANGVPRPAGALAGMIDAAKACWGKWEKEIPLLVLEEAGDATWRGIVTAGDGERTAHYNRRLGFRIP